MAQYNSLTDRVRQMLGGIPQTLSDIGNRVGSNMQWAGKQVQQNVQQAQSQILSPQNVNAFQRGVLKLPAMAQNSITQAAQSPYPLQSFLPKKIMAAAPEVAKYFDQRQTPVLLSKKGLGQYAKAVGKTFDPISDIALAPYAGAKTYLGAAGIGSVFNAGSQIASNVANKNPLLANVLQAANIGAQQGIVQTPKISAITGGVTNPVIQNISAKVLQKFPQLSATGMQIVNRVVQGTLSIPEGRAIAKATGQDYNLTSAAIDFAIGAGIAPKVGKMMGDNVGLQAKPTGDIMDAETRKPVTLEEIKAKNTAALAKRQGTGIDAIWNNDPTLKARIDKAFSTGDTATVEKLLPQVPEQYKTNYVSKAIDPLLSEAKKYKSAEEFVKAQPKLYRGEGGTNQFSGKTAFIEGRNYAKDSSRAETFGKVGEYSLDPNARVLKINTVGKELDTIAKELGVSENSILSPSRLRQELSAKGYDAVEYTTRLGKNGKLDPDGKIVTDVIVLNDDAIKTKSQLTDIWNKANTAPVGKVTQTGQTQAPEVAKATIKTELPVQEMPSQKVAGDVLSSDQQSPSSPASIPEIDPVQKIITALKGAKPVRGQQEAIYSKIRSQQAGALTGIGKNLKGEAGYYQKLGQLKGELPKVQFESIKKQFTQNELDGLFNKIESSNLGTFEKVNAQTGLRKLLGTEGGTIPTNSELQLLNEVFPPEFIQAVLDNRPTIQKLFSLAENALNLPRSIMATADLSAPLRQGIFLIGRPKQWGSAFKEMFKYAFSEDAYRGLQDQIKSRPSYQMMRDNKLAITDMSPLLLSREENFMSNLAEKIPGFGAIAKGSNRAYSGFLNKLRADTFDDLLKNAKQQGLEVDGSSKVVADIANFVNTATGRGDLGAFQKAAPILNATMFSPRLVASRINLMNPAYYMKLDPFVRKEALKSLVTFVGAGASVLALSKLAGAEVGTDPRSADFGKIKVGNTRFDVWGGFQQYVRALSQLISGQYISTTTGKTLNLGEGYNAPTRKDILLRFFESKESPVMSFATSILSGKGAMGDKFNLPVEVIDRFIPMLAQDMTDLYKEWGPKGLIMGIPGAFGVGSQTYQDRIPMQGKTPMGKPNIQWRQAPGLGEDILNKITGTELSNIPKDQWAPLVEQKKQESLWNIQYSGVKASVLETGQPQTVKNPITGENISVYLQDGMVKTKKVSTETKQPTLKLKKASTKKASKPKATKVSIKKLSSPKITKSARIKIKVPKLKKPKTLKLKKYTVKLSK